MPDAWLATTIPPPVSPCRKGAGRSLKPTNFRPWIHRQYHPLTRSSRPACQLSPMRRVRAFRTAATVAGMAHIHATTHSRMAVGTRSEGESRVIVEGCPRGAGLETVEELSTS